MSDAREHIDLAIVGAGASGLAAAIFAAKEHAARSLRIVVFEGARQIGAKILISGGGRCNVTNTVVAPADYWSSSPAIVRNVLRTFDVRRTIEWFQEMGVELVAEPSGKYFPVTNSARTVRDALVSAAIRGGCELRTGMRVETLSPEGGQFLLSFGSASAVVVSRRVILATGGLALPKSGSDGTGLEWLRRLGHTVVDPVPALVPLILQPDSSPAGRFAEFAGISFGARIRFTSPLTGEIFETCGSLLFTHFGLSGPAVLDISRHVSRELRRSGGPLTITLGHERFATEAEALAFLHAQRAAHPRRNVNSVLAQLYPERFAAALAGPLAHKKLGELRREEIAQLAQNIVCLPAIVIGDRGFAFAEVTAGGVDLREVNWRTMESRLVPGLHLCGELLDVDGRIGGFNFQWAWASGYIAGKAAARALLDAAKPRPSSARS